MHTCAFLVLLVLPAWTETSEAWRQAGRTAGLILSKCYRNQEVKISSNPRQLPAILVGCLRRRGLAALYKAAEADVVEVTEGIELVKYKLSNITELQRNIIISRSLEENDADWKRQFADALAHLFNTHVLKIRLKSLDAQPSAEGRGRRRQNMFSQLLMFGLIAAAFIVIPMGFQFLAILGGKALLLAKMALLLTSIQGLKKIATSNFNYGLYSTYGQPCKTLDYPDLLDVFFSFDVESLRGGGYGYFDGKVFCLGQYDRQWPYDGIEGQRAPNYASYEGYDYLHPRIDIIKENISS
ncbi:unnamed protein product [Phyllotreta striolata]|uniref:Uncharacterized protein n=1 Tax=Phyllotreta striolata TaxID=444603 RepID=A0A9N9TZG5_PHYSR|nr:unnamed protein product [Phyllotreta striolata]